jgi:hypothetical protein
MKLSVETRNKLTGMMSLYRVSADPVRAGTDIINYIETLTSKPRTDQKIVDQTEELAKAIARTEGFSFTEPCRESSNPRLQHFWKTACMAQEVLTGTDVENALANLEPMDVAEKWILYALDHHLVSYTAGPALFQGLRNRANPESVFRDYSATCRTPAFISDALAASIIKMAEDLQRLEDGK